MKNAHKIGIGKLETKRSFERLKHRWEDNIKVYAKEIGCEDMNWIF
jgi:hypothetical protein